MRLLDFGDKHDYQPLDRGIAFVQYYEDGDKYTPSNPFDYHYYFWLHMQWDAVTRADYCQEALLMGGHL